MTVVSFSADIFLRNGANEMVQMKWYKYSHLFEQLGPNGVQIAEMFQ